MKRRILLLLSLFPTLLCSAEGFLPAARLLHPLYCHTADPPARRALLQPPGSKYLRFDSALANNFIVELQDTDKSLGLELDSESYLFRIAYSQGFLPFLELACNIDITMQGKGILDPVISGFHELLGFPNGGRDHRPDNRYTMMIEHREETLTDVSEPALPSLFFALEPRIALYQKSGSTVTLGLWTSFELSQSHSAIQTAAGVPAPELALRVYFSQKISSLLIHASVGLKSNQDLDLISGDLAKNLSFTGSLGLSWQLSPLIELNLLAHGQSSRYALGYERSDRFSAQLYTAVSFYLSETSILQCGFSEEFFSFAASDFGVQTSLIRLF